MKRLIFGVALIGIASIGFSLKNDDIKSDTNYCVTIGCPNTGNFKETINAPGGSSQARKIAQARYPQCTIKMISTGACK